MKRLHLYTALLLFALPQALMAQRVELKKEINEQYNLSNSDEVSISNQYGDVVVNTWTRQEVTISVEIKAWAPSESKAQDMLERIEIDYGQSAGDVSFSTEIAYKSININDRSGFQINYTVNMPIENPLNLENKYGAVTLADFDGNLNLKVKYGQLQAGELRGKDVGIEMKYSKGSIQSVNQGALDFKYSGNMTIGRVGDITLSDKYGGITIGEADNIVAEIAYSGLNIGALSNSLSLDSKYAGCTIRGVKPGFKKVAVENAYGSVTLEFDPQASFQFDIETKFGEFKSSLDGLDIQHEIKENTSSQYRGIRGTSPSGKVTIESSFGGVKFK